MNSDRDVVRYVVVVHGIGQQRKNESVRSVIERFAQARSASGAQVGAPLTLGQLASHLEQAPVGRFDMGLERGWIELEGIPQRPGTEAEPPFVGRPTDSPGRNLRFVDLHWSSVMDGQFDAFGEPVADWTRALIDRLEIREAPRWIPQLLRTMRAGVLPLQTVLRRRDPQLAEMVFDRFLGDVQLYGEYQATRGMAVRRFHERLAKLDADHYAAEQETGRPARDPRYIVIAHSLGTVMSFDALVFAHLHRSSQPGTLARLLPEYGRNPSTNEADHEWQNLEWIRSVDAFVTLGSPIDKFLAFWWLNYTHLVAGRADGGAAGSRTTTPGADRIPHYNYCDEQDPVGHNLDVAYSKDSVAADIFDRREDVVYTRYPLPGVAHVGYWTDTALFRRILDLTVDGRTADQAVPVAWFKWGTYLQSLAWTYLLVPLLGWLASTVAMMWAVNGAQNFGTRLLWVMVSLGALLGSCWLMRLLVEWREIVITKGLASTALSAGQRRVRAVSETLFRALVVVVPVVWAYLLIAAVAGLDDAPLPDAIAGLAGQRLAGLWTPVSSAVSWIDQIAWPHALQPFVAIWNANRTTLALVGSAYGFLLGLWNLLVFARIRWVFPPSAVSLDFGRYVTEDPTKRRTRTS